MKPMKPLKPLKPMLIAFALIAGAMAFGSAHAGTVSADYDKVSSISIGSTGILYIFMVEDEINPGFCNKPGRYALAADSEQYNIIYAQVLTAMAAGYPLRFAINDDSCIADYPSVSRSAMRVE